MQGNRQELRRDHSGRAFAGLLVTGFAALTIAMKPPFATSDDSKQSPADRTNTPRATVAAEGPSDDVKRQRLRLRMIAKNYKDNKEAFAFGKFRIRCLTHRAETLQDALAGKWADLPRNKPPWKWPAAFVLTRSPGRLKSTNKRS
jgi:hypothetical protein